MFNWKSMKMNVNYADLQYPVDLLQMCMWDRAQYRLSQCAELDELSDEELSECLNEPQPTSRHKQFSKTENWFPNIRQQWTQREAPLLELLSIYPCKEPNITVVYSWPCSK